MPAAALLVLILAQGPPGETGQADQLARVRRALTETPAINVPPVTTERGPVFRVTVRGKRPVEAPWDNWSAVPSNIRPWFRAYHHEFLEQVLKNRERSEVFRGATLYPIGIDIVPLMQLLARHINAANQRRQEANAKEEVRLALEKFLACRTNSNRSGC